MIVNFYCGKFLQNKIFAVFFLFFLFFFWPEKTRTTGKDQGGETQQGSANRTFERGGLVFTDMLSSVIGEFWSHGCGAPFSGRNTKSTWRSLEISGNV